MKKVHFIPVGWVEKGIVGLHLVAYPTQIDRRDIDQPYTGRRESLVLANRHSARLLKAA